MATPIPSLIGLTGSMVIIGIGLKTIEQIDVQGKKIIKPSKIKFNPMAQARRVTQL